MILVKWGGSGSARYPEGSCGSLQEGCSSRAVRVNGRKTIKHKNMFQYAQFLPIHEKMGGSEHLDSTFSPMHILDALRLTAGPHPILDDEPVRADTFLTERICASERSG
jgi:hypothetical protein